MKTRQTLVCGVFAVLLTLAGAGMAFAQETAKSPKAPKAPKSPGATEAPGATETPEKDDGFSLSIGGGIIIGGDFGGGGEYTYETLVPYQNYSGMGYYTFLMPMKTEKSEKRSGFGNGGFIFFDATYVELSLGFYGGSSTVTTTNVDTGIPFFVFMNGDPSYYLESNRETKVTFNIMNLNIGLLGKYPIAVNEGLRLFPLFGIDYQVTITGEGEVTETTVDYDYDSALWFKLGVGMDFLVTKKIFFRPEALYGIRLASKNESEFYDKTKLGHGFTVKLAVGSQL